jgi:hypothetical protein
MQFLEISWDFGILGFSKILGFFQRFFGIFDEVYEDFQSNLPLVVNCRCHRTPFSVHPVRKYIMQRDNSLSIWNNSRILFNCEEMAFCNNSYVLN